MKIAHAELRKLLSFKEVYVALFLCLGLSTIHFYSRGLSDSNKILYILNDVDPVIVPVRYMFFLKFDLPVYLPEEGRAVAEAWRDKFLVLVDRE